MYLLHCGFIPWQLFGMKFQDLDQLLDNEFEVSTGNFFYLLKKLIRSDLAILC